MRGEPAVQAGMPSCTHRFFNRVRLPTFVGTVPLSVLLPRNLRAEALCEHCARSVVGGGRGAQVGQQRQTAQGGWDSPAQLVGSEITVRAETASVSRRPRLRGRRSGDSRRRTHRVVSTAALLHVVP